MIKKYAVICLILFVVMPVKAGVYQCIKPDGKIEFRDSPCPNSDATQLFLPIAYHKTDAQAEAKTEKQTKQALKSKKQTATLAKKEMRTKQRQEKQVAQETEKEKRRVAKMNGLTEKIKRVETELKSGCKIKRSNRLKKELVQYQDKQRQWAAKKNK